MPPREDGEPLPVPRQLPRAPRNGRVQKATEPVSHCRSHSLGRSFQLPASPRAGTRRVELGLSCGQRLGMEPGGTRDSPPLPALFGRLRSRQLQPWIITACSCRGVRGKQGEQEERAAGPASLPFPRLPQPRPQSPLTVCHGGLHGLDPGHDFCQVRKRGGGTGHVLKHSIMV